MNKQQLTTTVPNRCNGGLSTLELIELSIPDGRGKTASLRIGDLEVPLSSTKEIRLKVQRARALLTLDLVGPMRVGGSVPIDAEAAEALTELREHGELRVFSLRGFWTGPTRT